jgi:hypothetical protein
MRTDYEIKDQPPIKDYIHQSNLIEGFDLEIADQLSYDAWRWLITKGKMDLKTIKLLQKRITKFQYDLPDDMRGAWRTVDVYVAGYKGRPWFYLNDLMQDWVQSLHLISPKTAHIRFEKIHPFIDGNGRTGRMLMWWMQRQRHEAMTYIAEKDKLDYYAWFN